MRLRESDVDVYYEKFKDRQKPMNNMPILSFRVDAWPCKGRER